MSKSELRPGAEAVLEKGWLAAHKWLLLRRASQIGILLLFLVGPWFGWWIVKGNLAYSYTLGVLPLADPYVLLQSLAAGQVPWHRRLCPGSRPLASGPGGGRRCARDRVFRPAPPGALMPWMKR